MLHRELTDGRIPWHFVLTGSSSWAGRNTAVEKQLKAYVIRYKIRFWFVYDLKMANIDVRQRKIAFFSPEPVVSLAGLANQRYR